MINSKASPKNLKYELGSGWQTSKLFPNCNLNSRYIDTRRAALLSYQNRWIWLAASAAFLGILVVAIHWNRHLIRRQLHGYKTLGISKNFIYLTMFLFGLFAFTFCFGPMFVGLVSTLSESTPK